MGRASDFPVGSPLSQIQPVDAFVFAGPGNKPSANLTETLIPGRQPYQLSNRQDIITNPNEGPLALTLNVNSISYIRGEKIHLFMICAAHVVLLCDLQ